MKEKIIYLFYKFISFFTELFPRSGSRIIDAVLFILLGNPLPVNIIRTINRSRLKTGNFQKICVLCDMNIGDSIIVQGAILGLRDFLPDARIDYVINQSAKDLLAGSPEISNLFAVYSGSIVPTRQDIHAINEILTRTKYDLVFNFCPFISSKEIAISSSTKFINYHGIAAAVIRAEKDPMAKNHMLYQAHQFIENLFPDFNDRENKNFRGGHIYLSREAANKAAKFINGSGLDPVRPKIFLNPDASCRFTRIPLDIQVSLLQRLTELPVNILLGAGHSKRNIEFSILKALPENRRQNIRIVPAVTPLDVYAAIIDLCDIYITGDTGPLHIAAARKYAERKTDKFRNRTAIFSVFGATPPRIYGYDTRLPGFFQANQDAPSHVYIAPSSCRNMVCIAKKFITCTPYCFFGSLDIEKIISDIRSYFNMDERMGQENVNAKIMQA